MTLLQPFDTSVLWLSLLMVTGSVSTDKHKEKMYCCPVLQRSAPAVNGLPGRDGRDGPKGEKGEPGTGLWPFRDPMRPGTLMGPPRRGNRPWAQGEKGAKGILDQHVKKADVRVFSFHVLVLALNGKIKEAGEKIIASNGKVVGFTSALESCEKAGGTLARPTNKEENEAILSFVQQYNKYAYLGIKEHENSGQFRHIYGTPLNYTNWHRNEPNGKGTEQCVEMYSDGSWNDKNCNQHRLIIWEHVEVYTDGTRCNQNHLMPASFSAALWRAPWAALAYPLSLHS
uniref:C-type lectin domain-containing protein n=1 Tax=Falco tinnunculus TaxID=100819 RepID=A0A8C4UGH9_FALTI